MLFPKSSGSYVHGKNKFEIRRLLYVELYEGYSIWNKWSKRHIRLESHVF